jgi:hypothetical protein
MPKTKRDYLKRRVAQAHRHMEECYKPLADLEVTFRDQHPDLADGLVHSARMVQLAQQLLEEFAAFAWEMPPESIPKFLK